MPNDKFNVVGTNIAEKASLIWSVADKLVGPFKPHEYGLVILPMTVVKRFHDCLLPTHDDVLKMYDKVKQFEVIDGFLTKASGYQFYNISKFTFETLLADPENIEANFRNYLAGFSPNVQDVLAKFDFDNIIKRLVECNSLYLIIKEFNGVRGYLGPDKISAVDCGYVFEDLVRRFSESYGEEAGAHFTSRDIIYLMTDILLSDASLDEGNVTVYDMTMGTSQMLSCMEERIHELNSETTVTCFGQEFNPSTFAIAKADMMIRGGDPNNMRFGDTLSEDQFKGFKFDYIISNPPFGIEWKREQKAVEAEAKLGEGGRFMPGLPKISDGQQLFMLNGIAKLAADGKMAIIQNGSPLFSGDAGSGPSNIRQYILENDWLDAIIQLPTDSFMNTPIGTYIWVINKNKPAHRLDKVQLIDASHCYEQRRKSIGNKRYDITDRCRELIVNAYGEFQNNAVYGDKPGIYCESKIFDAVEFGYNKIVVERPLRYSYVVNDETYNKTAAFLAKSGVKLEEDILPFEALEETINSIASQLPKKTHQNMAQTACGQFLRVLKTFIRNEPYNDTAEFEKMFNARAEGKQISLSHFSDFCLFIKVKSPEGSVETKRGKPVPDADLRDTENVPMAEDIDAYFKREVFPYAPDAWIDKSKTKAGYEIPMTRYFYEYKAPEKSEDILARIHSLETEISATLDSLFGKEN